MRLFYRKSTKEWVAEVDINISPYYSAVIREPAKTKEVALRRSIKAYKRGIKEAISEIKDEPKDKESKK